MMGISSIGAPDDNNGNKVDSVHQYILGSAINGEAQKYLGDSGQLALSMAQLLLWLVKQWNRL